MTEQPTTLAHDIILRRGEHPVIDGRVFPWFIEYNGISVDVRQDDLNVLVVHILFDGTCCLGDHH